MPTEYIPRVVVKFLDNLIPRTPKAASEFLAHLITEYEWGAIEGDNEGITIRRLFAELNESRLLELMSIAQRREPNYLPPNFLTYFAVACPSPVDPQAVANALSLWPTVQAAYVEGGPVKPPAINPSNEPYYEIVDSLDPYWPGQRYLGGATNIDLSGTIYKVSGIYVEDAWLVPGGDGAAPQPGLQFIDLEQGWNLAHEDLLGADITGLPGVNYAYFGHGTAVLGIVVAEDNNVGCVGIAPHVASKRVVSEQRDAVTFSTAAAISVAIDVLHFGDVLLLEAQTHYPWVNPSHYKVPVEVYLATFDIIRLGSALGIIIVEAAGNGGHYLDALSYPTKGRDSGAILVGAASLIDPHFRRDSVNSPTYGEYTNYGSRIDCYAWGENIVTLGDGAAGTGNSDYTAGFGLTSGASAIIAGAALSVQGIAANKGYRLGSRQMRTILSDPATGTRSQNPNPGGDDIGVMPNLQNIVPVVLNLVPDVYIRDFVGDIGNSHNGIIAASPDIILRPLPLIDPLIDAARYNQDPPAAIDEAFGAQSGTENDPTLSIRAKLGNDHAIYVRVKNRGPIDATNVTATVYWSEPSTLVTPNTWKPAGGLSIVIPHVSAGNGLTVSPAIIWPGSQILVPGHYCFVALIGNAKDPAPDPLDFGSMVNYERFIRENNNVSWRNFDVVDYLLGATSSPIQLRFYIRGPWDKARDMSLEVISTLPAKAQLTVQVPIHQKDVLTGLGSVEMDEQHEFVRVTVNPHGMSKAKPFKFPKDFCAEAHLLVQFPEDFRHGTYDIYVRQLYEGREIGRITWRLRPLEQVRVSDEV